MKKQFLISVLGTAIGVALTFIVSGMLERRNKEQARRLTAIMVIHDIDNTIDILKAWKDEEEQENEWLRIAMKQRDQQGVMPYDTLSTILTYLTESYVNFSFDTSKEKIFNSDLDTWQNLGNMAFLDNVQEFYHSRQSFQEMVNQAVMWKNPISDEEYTRVNMETGWVTQDEYADAIWPFLKKKLHDDRVVFYINVAGTRLNYLSQWIDYWTKKNNENKFLMGITDREMEDYISSISKKGVPLTRSKLLGRWGFTVEDSANEYDFRGDHSYTFASDYVSSFSKTATWSGRLKMKFSYRGEWAFQGDSLVLTPDFSTIDIQIDPSGLVPEENMQDSLDTWVNSYRESYLAYFRDMADKGEKYAYKALLDSSRDKTEWTDSDGSVRYLKRKRE